LLQIDGNMVTGANVGPITFSAMVVTVLKRHRSDGDKSAALEQPAGGLSVDSASDNARLASPQDAFERRTLMVGSGVNLLGTVQNAELIVVEGSIMSATIGATELVVHEGGTVKGEADVENADVSGAVDGSLDVQGMLVIRATGQVRGSTRCRRLAVDEGGQISGRMEVITESATSPTSGSG
jgi:cytoskeletal protein CcmA (bactofilin family)